jgi:hypothetical protein
MNDLIDNKEDEFVEVPPRERHELTGDPHITTFQHLNPETGIWKYTHVLVDGPNEVLNVWED